MHCLGRTATGGTPLRCQGLEPYRTARESASQSRASQALGRGFLKERSSSSFGTSFRSNLRSLRMAQTGEGPAEATTLDPPTGPHHAIPTVGTGPCLTHQTVVLSRIRLLYHAKIARCELSRTGGCESARSDKLVTLNPSITKELILRNDTQSFNALVHHNRLLATMTVETPKPLRRCRARPSDPRRLHHASGIL